MRILIRNKRKFYEGGAVCPLLIETEEIVVKDSIGELPWWQKYTLTLNEASQYFGIGYKKLKMFVEEHSDEKFVLWNGNRAQIKRQMFEKYINEEMSAI